MTAASRIAVMNAGKIVQVATPDRLYETPNSVYVADFIGDVNLFAGNAAPKYGMLTEIHWAEGQPSIAAAA